MEKKVENKNELVVEVYGIKLRLSDEEVKRTSELTSEDIDALRKVRMCVLNSRRNRSGNRTYTLTAHLVLNDVKFEKRLDPQEFKRILISNGLEVNLNQDIKDQRIPCGIRYIHGISVSTGERYYALQLFPYGNKNALIRRTMGCGFEFLHEKEIVDMGITDVTIRNTDGTVKEVKPFSECVVFRKTTEVVDDAASMLSDDYYE